MPVDPLLYLAFVPAVLALVVTPGPDMLFAMAQGLRGGRRPAVAAAAGISAGAMVNATLAGLGLGALVAAAPWLFGVVRWVGVAYLLWLAVKTLRTPLSGENARPVRPSRAFRDGLVVNLSNPSVILFILAFIPQFVDPARPILPQFLIYGATIAALGFAVKAVVGTSAGTIGPWLARTPRAERTLRAVTAGMFGAIALRVAWSGLRP
ncbi:MAG: LysE family translocator [Shimia sp.]